MGMRGDSSEYDDAEDDLAAVDGSSSSDDANPLLWPPLLSFSENVSCGALASKLLADDGGNDNDDDDNEDDLWSR